MKPVLRFLSAWALVIAAALAGCQAAYPPWTPSGPVLADGASPFPPNRTAPAVLADLEASGCTVDGGLAAIEQAHARFDRVPIWDCLFLADASVAGCGGCP